MNENKENKNNKRFLIRMKIEGVGMIMKGNIVFKHITKCVLILAVLIACFTLDGNKVYAKDMKEVKIEKLNVKVYKGTVKNNMALKNMSYDIYYYDTNKNKKYALKKGQTDKNGTIKVKIKVPKNVKYVYINYKTSNDKVGKVVSILGKEHSFVYSLKLSGGKINLEPVIQFSKTDANYNDFVYNVVNTFDIYNQIYDKLDSDIKLTKKVLDKNGIKTKQKSYKLPKVNLMYDYRYTKSGGLFTKVGGKGLGDLKPNERYIKIGYKNSTKDFSQSKVNDNIWVNLSHEWNHALMFNSGAKMLGGGYDSHSSYNENLNTVWKEGWALFQANRTTWGYNHNVRLDYDVQKTRRNILYGKPTNVTAMNVLRDIYDYTGKHEPNETFDIGLNISPKFDVQYKGTSREKLASGLMFISMYDSKASTLEEYLKYLRDESGMIKDKNKFKEVLVVNGLTNNLKFKYYNK